MHSMTNGQSNNVTVLAGTPTYSQQNGGQSSCSESPTIGKEGNQLQVILTIRMLMQGKEVGSIIGKKGDYVKQIREQSGAKINISDGSSPERIVTISGTAPAIDRAFSMVARKFEDDLQALQASAIKPPITLRLIVPASQCGSLIGKGGSKIREIRDKTGASLQVATEMLSNSTEKPVTISGSSEALIGCMREICQILLEAPAKGPTIQYKPANTSYNPLAVVNSAAAIAAAAAVQKNKTTNATIAGLPLGIGGALQQQQLGGLLPTLGNPLQATLQELALFQQQQHNQQPLSPFVDVSRLLQLPQFGTSTGQTASSAVLPNAMLSTANHAALLAAMNNPALAAITTSAPSTAAAMPYGLDPATAALLMQQQQQVIDPAQQILQQQQLQLYYQQQQQQAAVDSAASHQQLSGRTMASNGQAVKEGIAVLPTGNNSAQKQRFTPY